MTASKVRLDSAGVAAVLKSAAVAATVTAAAEQVAGQVRSQGVTVAHGEDLPVVVNSYVTDRAAASVTLAHPAGLAVQAKHGALTAAAAAVGLEVTEKA